MFKISAYYPPEKTWYLVKEIRWDETGEIEEIELEPGYCFFADAGTLGQLTVKIEDKNGTTLYYHKITSYGEPKTKIFH